MADKVYAFDFVAHTTQRISYTELQVAAIIEQARLTTPENVVYLHDGTLNIDGTMERLIRSAYRKESARLHADLFKQSRNPNIAVDVWPRGRSVNLLSAPINELEIALVSGNAEANEI